MPVAHIDMSFPNGIFISEVVCVASFVPDPDVRHRTLAFEKSFSDVVSGQATSTNVPDAFPPEIPRLTLSDNHKELVLSKKHVQLTLRFEPSSEKTFEQQYAIAKRNMEKFWQAVCKLVEDQNRREVGMVVTTAVPFTDSPDKIGKEIFSRFCKVAALGDVASCDVRFGFRAGDIFKNFSAGHYELRAIPVESSKTGSTAPFGVPMDQLEVTGRGFEYKFDVNNKPVLQERGSCPADAGDVIIKSMTELVFHDSKQLLDW